MQTGKYLAKARRLSHNKLRATDYPQLHRVQFIAELERRRNPRVETTTQRLRYPALYRELGAFEDDVIAALATTDEARQVAQAAKHHRVLEGLFNQRLSQEDLAYYRANGMEVAPGLKSLLPVAERFYDLAQSRDAALVENTLAWVKGQGSRVKGNAVVLIAGGFHTQGMTDLLKQRTIPYVVIVPRVEGELDEQRYELLLAGQLPSADELWREAQQTLVPPLATQAGTPKFQKIVALFTALTMNLYAQRGLGLFPRREPVRLPAQSSSTSRPAAKRDDKDKDDELIGGGAPKKTEPSPTSPSVDRRFHNIHDVFGANKISVLARLKEAINPDGKRRRVLYIGSGADLTTALLATNAEELVFIDQLPFTFKTPSRGSISEHRAVYWRGKQRSGWSAAEYLARVGLRIPLVEWELPLLGATNVREEPRGDGVYRITFDWAYPGAAAQPRTLLLAAGMPIQRRMAQLRASAPASQGRPLQAALARGVDIYIHKAFDSGGSRVKQEIADAVHQYLGADGLILADGGKLIADTFASDQRFQPESRPAAAMPWGYGLLRIFRKRAAPHTAGTDHDFTLSMFGGGQFRNLFRAFRASPVQGPPKTPMEAVGSSAAKSAAKQWWKPQNNGDIVWVDPALGAALVADGNNSDLKTGLPLPGQHIASRIARDRVQATLVNGLASATSPEAVQALYRSAVSSAHQAIQEQRKQDERYERIGTTLASVVLWFDAQRRPHLIGVNIGDGQVYLNHREGGRRAARQVSSDGDVAMNGQLKASGVLGSSQFSIEAHQQLQAPVTAGDLVLLVSDGIVRNLGHEDILALMEATPDPQRLVNRLIRAARQVARGRYGLPDDFSAVALMVPAPARSGSAVVPVAGAAPSEQEGGQGTTRRTFLRGFLGATVLGLAGASAARAAFERPAAPAGVPAGVVPKDAFRVGSKLSVGSYRDPANARRHYDAIQALRLPGVVASMEPAVVDGVTWHRVLISVDPIKQPQAIGAIFEHIGGLVGLHPVVFDIIAEMESGGRHFTRRGLLTWSHRGAVGLMQTKEIAIKEINRLRKLPAKELTEGQRNLLALFETDLVWELVKGDPKENARAGAVYLALLHEKFAGLAEDPLAAAVLAYNGGETMVRQLIQEHGRTQYVSHVPFQETRDYLAKFQRLFAQRMGHAYSAGAMRPLKPVPAPIAPPAPAAPAVRVSAKALPRPPGAVVTDVLMRGLFLPGVWLFIGRAFGVMAKDAARSWRTRNIRVLQSSEQVE